MLVMLCIAIVILICFLIGGIGKAGAHRSPAGQFRHDPIGLPLTIMCCMMLLSLVGLVWARHLSKQTPPSAEVTATQATVSYEPTPPVSVEVNPPQQVIVQYQNADGRVLIEGSTQMTITTDSTPSEDAKPAEEAKQAEDLSEPTTSNAEQPCQCNR
ncbi:MAG TPA: hypothetical protein VKU00_22730 [Chthonomonadaceae bacterium]|nr:hypothetical protein [Chthonomonadaceae bacterium]